jgi:hypothetical protein
MSHRLRAAGLDLQADDARARDAGPLDDLGAEP